MQGAAGQQSLGDLEEDSAVLQLCEPRVGSTCYLQHVVCLVNPESWCIDEASKRKVNVVFIYSLCSVLDSRNTEVPFALDIPHMPSPGIVTFLP